MGGIYEATGIIKSLNTGTVSGKLLSKGGAAGVFKGMRVTAAGSKADLNERILQILHGNAICSAVKQRKVKNNRTDTLCPDSIIEKDLVCSQKHRAFFKSMIGGKFFFHVEFQDWLKTHAGQTYQDAVDAWYAIQEQKKHKKTVISPQFEYNTYIRAFFADNPGRSLKEAIMCWNHRKAIPGPHVYQKEDLLVLNEQEDER